MKYHYVYRITNIVKNKHYYGTRTAKCLPIEDLGIKYFSSSTDKEFIQDQKSNPDSYEYKIVRVCPTRIEAIQLEIKLHNKFNVGVNESFYNKCKQTSTGFDITGNKIIAKKISDSCKGRSSSFKGKCHTQKTIEKLKEIGRNQIFTDEHRRAISKALSGSNNPMYGKNHTSKTREKMSISGKNKIFTTSHRNNISIACSKVIKTDEWNRKVSEARSGSKLMNNGTLTKYINKDDIQNKLSDGWVFGRIKK